MAIQLAAPSATVYTANRQGTFLRDGAPSAHARHGSLDLLLQAHPARQLVLLDTSVDHSSTENLVAHEAFKRDVVTTLRQRDALGMAIGFSSGITQVSSLRVSDAAPHMLEYRNQKLAQESLFNTLACPVFLPNIFTLVGPITYATQGAAWAQILKARLLRSSCVALNEPHAQKAWVSEFQVFKSVVYFLAQAAPQSVKGPLVNGVFTLADIACGSYLPVPPLVYAAGGGTGWLDGDYLPASPVAEVHPIGEELLRSLCP